MSLDKRKNKEYNKYINKKQRNGDKKMSLYLNMWEIIVICVTVIIVTWLKK